MYASLKRDLLFIDLEFYPKLIVWFERKGSWTLLENVKLRENFNIFIAFFIVIITTLFIRKMWGEKIPKVSYNEEVKYRATYKHISVLIWKKVPIENCRVLGKIRPKRGTFHSHWPANRSVATEVTQFLRRRGKEKRRREKSQICTPSLYIGYFGEKTTWKKAFCCGTFSRIRTDIYLHFTRSSRSYFTISKLRQRINKIKWRSMIK